ncbi:GDP-4-dehydro-6-deoxy-D-mannose reductase [Pseudoxanthomonas japonensis]|uniref:GDP-mannose 4,6-dehydratase n=1 Tax=Pseudoxanthomonas japonensis TaxID=69284 RepID=UPI00285A72E2|nr:GDP-mannose 4,6-dehydratase [Pseudoxanthomonas japonensis]MDR7067982.1 GDP-4-dehydro-6-deoxy-D-mannose reductase [Pseudoxanthomonas japonensis]
MSRRSARILVTGAGGFVGRYVLDAITQGGFGDAEAIVPASDWDIRSLESTRNVVAEAAPHAVVHLAAQSFVPKSFEDPAETLAVNVGGTANLIKTLQEQGFGGRFLYISSGDIYGVVAEADLPVTENIQPQPRNPYAVSKWAAEQLCLQARRTHGLDCIIARPFNHVGPGQSDRFVLPSLASQIAEIEAGRRAPLIEVGDIDSTRDFLDVRDVVAAYAALLLAGTPGATYVVASGSERSVRELLQLMLAHTDAKPEIRVDPARMRPSEQKRMLADSRRLREDTDWRPSLSLETTVLNLLDYARKSKQ